MDSIREVRKHPIREIAERTKGYIGLDKNGNKNGVGIEGAFVKYLNGKDGKVIKQKIAKGQYKPIRDENVVEPIDGYDIVSTLNVYIQDIAHHALLQSLQKNKAEHGCVIVRLIQYCLELFCSQNLQKLILDTVQLNYTITEVGLK